MSSSTISTHGAGRVSSLALLSGEKLERRLEELLHQERFTPPSQFVARESVNDASLHVRAELEPDAFWAEQARTLHWDEPFTTVLDDLTSEGPLTLGVDMPDALVFSDSIAGRADARPQVFVCWWTNGGLDAAWMHVAGELGDATTPQLVRTLLEPELQALLVVLDLSELAFMDIFGVHAIVNASIRARQGGRRLFVLRGSPKVDRMFTLTESSDVEIGDVDPVEPPVQALLELAEEDLAPRRSALAIRGLVRPIPECGRDGASLVRS
jgi:anti-anti-sigma factor